MHREKLEKLVWPRTHTDEGGTEIGDQDLKYSEVLQFGLSSVPRLSACVRG